MHDREVEQVVATRQPVHGEAPFAGIFGCRIYNQLLRYAVRRRRSSAERGRSGDHIHPLPAEDGAVPAAGLAEPGTDLRMLVVEDNLDLGSFLAQIPQDLGYETAWATNGREALDRLGERAPFVLVFSDVVMPSMSGMDLAFGIQRRYPDRPVILTYGHSHVLAEEGRHGFKFLRKPYASEDLSWALRHAVPQGGARP